MNGNWAAVTATYRVGMRVQPLTGSARLTVASVDDERLCLHHRLWQACLHREEFDTAVGVLRTENDGRTPVAFSETLRIHLATLPGAETGCSRTPNLCAIVLRDLGLLTPPAGDS